MSKKATLNAVSVNRENQVGDSRQRAVVAQSLSKFLGSSYVLYQKTQFYHWNVIGANFYSLHLLFESQYKELQEAVDTIAERIRAIGHIAPGTASEFSALSSIAEDRKLPAHDRDMLTNLLKAHEACSKEAHQLMKTAEKMNDDATADLMIQRMEVHDKAAWMLRSFVP